jgi:hypothetical protein
MNESDYDKLLDGPPPTEFLIAAFGTYHNPLPFVVDRALADDCVQVVAQGPIGGAELLTLLDAQPLIVPAHILGWASFETRDDGIWAINVKWAVQSMRAVVKHGRYPTAVFKLRQGPRGSIFGVLMTDTPTPGVSRPLCPAREQYGSTENEVRCS